MRSFKRGTVCLAVTAMVCAGGLAGETVWAADVQAQAIRESYYQDFHQYAMEERLYEASAAGDYAIEELADETHTQEQQAENAPSQEGAVDVIPTPAGRAQGVSSREATGTEDAQIENGWFTAADGTYYYRNGELQKSWQTIDGKRYYFALTDGKRQTGWQTIEGKRYYFNPQSGELQVGLQTIDGKAYYLSPQSGELLTGLQSVDGKKYYFHAQSGERQTG